LSRVGPAGQVTYARHRRFAAASRFVPFLAVQFHLAGGPSRSTAAGTPESFVRATLDDAPIVHQQDQADAADGGKR